MNSTQSARKRRVLSAIQPTGGFHLGNYLGALQNWVTAQNDPSTDALYCVADLHAITVPRAPKELFNGTLEATQALLAIGIDPAKSTLFVQSHNADLHTQLGWLLECTSNIGELFRMTQFKAKAGDRESAGGGLLTYPVLMASDICIYDADDVPVGEDQRQHVELARDLARRFNSRYGPTLRVPRAVLPASGARVRDLSEPTKKMSKSANAAGTIFLLEDIGAVRKKIKRAVTDGENSVRFDPVAKPGISNLLSILAAISGKTEVELADRYVGYGTLKADVADAVADLLTPIQESYRTYASDRGELVRSLKIGADRAREIGTATLERATTNIGLFPSDPGTLEFRPSTMALEFGQQFGASGGGPSFG